MMIETVSVGSSSSGNSYIIMAGSHTIILDAGLPAKKIIAALETVGADLEDVEALLITHEHVDHVRSVRAVSRKCCNAVVVASRGTAEHADGFAHVPEDRLRIISAGDSYVISGGDEVSEDSDNCKDITITAFALSHDAAEPIGYTISTPDDKLAVITDSGVITDEIYDAVCDADQLVFEANHDVDMLMFGEYPYPVKVRIKGDRGHLSNDYAGDVLARILSDRGSGGSSGSRDRSLGQMARGDRPLRIMLAHLSFHNNMPLFARQTVEEALHGNGFTRGVDYTLEVAAKEGLTFMEPLNVEDGRLIAKGDIDA